MAKDDPLRRLPPKALSIICQRFRANDTRVNFFTISRRYSLRSGFGSVQRFVRWNGERCGDRTKLLESRVKSGGRDRSSFVAVRSDLGVTGRNLNGRVGDSESSVT